MAFYQPSSAGVPQAPIVGGTQSLAATEIANQQPAFNASESMMNAMNTSSKWEEMKAAKRLKGTEAAQRWLQSELYERLNQGTTDDPYGYIDPKTSSVDFEGMGKRQFHNNAKQVLRDAYENKVNEFGGLFNVSVFEQAWNAAKQQENQKILSEMYLDYKQGNITTTDFQMAARNQHFLDFYKDLKSEEQEQFQQNFGYDPGWQTWGEAIDRAPGQLYDWAYNKPGQALGATATLGLGVPAAGMAANWAYQKWAPGPKAYTANVTSAEDVLQKAQDKFDTNKSRRTWRYQSGPRKGRLVDIKDLRTGRYGKPAQDWAKLRKTRYNALSAAEKALADLQGAGKPSLWNLPKRGAQGVGRGISALGTSPRTQALAKFGKRALPYSVGGHLGYMGGAAAAKGLGLGEVGQAIAGTATGVGGSVGLAKVVKKLGDPAVRAKLKPLLKKYAPKLLVKLGASMAGYVGPQAAEPISTALGLAGTAWAAYDLVQLARAVPDIAALLTD